MHAVRWNEQKWGGRGAAGEGVVVGSGSGNYIMNGMNTRRWVDLAICRMYIPRNCP